MNNNLMYSEVIYFFGDQFLPSPPLLSTKFECISGNKVDVSKLSNLMVLSALSYLKEKNYIEIIMKPCKKFFFFNSTEPIIKVINNDTSLLSGIEMKIMKNSNKKNLLLTILNLLEEDCFNPWSEIIYITRKELASKNLLEIESKKGLLSNIVTYKFIPETKIQVEPMLTNVKRSLENFEKDNNGLFKNVKKVVSSAIALRKEQTESSFND